MNTFIIVGCGGTGSNVAPFLSRMTTRDVFFLIDNDVVEKRNVGRQSFQEFNVGENKAIALARKLNSNFNNEHYAVLKRIENPTQILELLEDVKTKTGRIYLIGCVDNNKTRIILENTFKEILDKLKIDVLYIDSGNEDTYGTVIVSSRKSKTVRSDLFDMTDAPIIEHCGDLIAEQNEQQYQINLDMALAIAKVVFAYDECREIPTVIKINGFSRTCEY